MVSFGTLSPVWPPWPHHWWVTWWGVTDVGTDAGWPWPVWSVRLTLSVWGSNMQCWLLWGRQRWAVWLLSLGARLQPATHMCSRDAGACAWAAACPQRLVSPAPLLCSYQAEMVLWVAKLWIHAVPAPSDSRGTAVNFAKTCQMIWLFDVKKPCCT